MRDYFKDNPSITCPVCKERKFRKYGIDRNGNNREYNICMTCARESFEFQTKKFIKK